MKIISHRGLWSTDSEKNKSVAFERSFKLGFGTETDVRDCCGKLIISHDMPEGNEETLDAFLTLASSYSSHLKPMTLALNIKADGLADSISEVLSRYPQLDIFVFDMSVPDMRSYFNIGINVFTRMSEVERQASFIENSSGIWLDSFTDIWFRNDLIEELIRARKRIAIVSPELHNRQYKELWGQLKCFAAYEDIILCTDKPEEANNYFFGGV